MMRHEYGQYFDHIQNKHVFWQQFYFDCLEDLEAIVYWSMSILDLLRFNTSKTKWDGAYDSHRKLWGIHTENYLHDHNFLTLYDPQSFESSLRQIEKDARELAARNKHKRENLLTPKGVWFVYYHDAGAHPLWVSDDELLARRWADENGYGDVKFWEYDTEWSNK